MNEKVVIVSNDYDRIDGRNAYQSDIKRLTLGCRASNYCFNKLHY